MEDYEDESKPCVDSGFKGATPCVGEVKGRASLAGTGRINWRCQAHYDELLGKAQRVEKRYPGSIRW